MALPVPDLDDRRFQQLVDDAKRMVQQKCPEWTDHNVSDPGVTLIETFAFMVDQLLWRLNRVPDRIYVKFLELLGMRLYPPSAARVGVTFWLAGIRREEVTVPAGTVVTTPRTEQDEAIAFATLADLEIAPCTVTTCAVEVLGTLTDRSQMLTVGEGFQSFGARPQPGDAFYVGLSNAVPSCAVAVRLECDIEGLGVDPEHPPIVWEAWCGHDWVECDLERDETGGLNRAGDVILHVPATHTQHVVGRRTAGWLRCRAVEPENWQSFYRASPRITRVAAFTMGGTTQAMNAHLVREEILGISEGVAGQRFALQQAPVVEAEEIPPRIECSIGEGWEPWTVVKDFAASHADDPHVILDTSTGEIVFGPAVQLADGRLRHFGKVPSKGAAVRIRGYHSGGGRQGNIGRGALSVLQSSVPYIGAVGNRRSAAGGVDGESMENAKLRGPIQLRSRERAVTPEDYEQLAREASVEVARVRCLPAMGGGERSGLVTVLVVPHVEDGRHGAVDLADLAPSAELLERVGRYLDVRRTIAARVVVEPPRYLGITVVASLRCRHRYDPAALERAALEALYGHFHPLRGGRGSYGWPFGRAVHAGEVYSVLQSLPGLDLIDEVRLYPADPLSGRRGDQAQKIDLGSGELAFSLGHQVRVIA